MPNESRELTVDHRKHPRYHVHWRVAIVFGEQGERETFHGKTYDLSLSGASIYSDHNVFVEEPVKVLLAIPSYVTNKPDKIIEISARMIYTVLSASHHQFRTGLHFQRFKSGGRKILEENLAKRADFDGK